MINHKNTLYMAAFVGIFAYAMDRTDSLFNIREDMRNLHTGTQHQDVYLTGQAAMNLLRRADTLKMLRLQDIEGESATLDKQPSSFMRAFFYDLILVGQSELLRIFLGMLERSYPGIGINWLYQDTQGRSITMLDKAIRLKQALIRAGNPVSSIDGIINVLIAHGGERYMDESEDDALSTQGDVASSQSQ